MTLKLEANIVTTKEKIVMTVVGHNFHNDLVKTINKLGQFWKAKKKSDWVSYQLEGIIGL